MTERTLPAPPRPRWRRQRGAGPVSCWALILTCQLMLILDATVMNVALPKIQADLHFSPTSLSWVMNAYSLAFGGLLLLGGRAGDLFGRRRMFLIGTVVFTVASLAGGFADSSALLLVARVVQGVGAAATGPSTLALIATTFTEPRERVQALALFSAMASGGFAIGLILGGLLTELMSWRAVLFINVPFGAAIVALAPRFVPEPERRRTHLDLPGAITGTAGVAALVYAFIRAASDGWGDTGALVTLAAGIALIAAFLTIEKRARQPLMPLRLFANRNRAAAYLNFFIGPMAMMSMFFFLTQFLQEVSHFAALATGFAFLPMAVALFTMTRLIPKLLPRFGPKPLTITGTALMIGGFVWLTQLAPESDYLTSLLGPMLLMGFGAGFAFSPLNIIIMATVPQEDAGAAGGVLQTLQQVGATLGLAILVTIFGRAGRKAAESGASPHQALVSGMTEAFVAATILAAITFGIALTFRRQER